MVTRVIDGDTVDVSINGVTERVRLVGIDTPERGETGFTEAGDFLRARLQEVDNQIFLERDGNDRDRFDRLRRRIWLSPGDVISLNRQIIDAGHGVLRSPGTP